MNEKLFDYIAVCPTAFHTCAHSADMLRESGYTELCEAQRWEIVSGGKYFVTRNGSSLIAFRVPAGKIAGLAKPGQICVKFGRIKHGLLLQKGVYKEGSLKTRRL
jgi:aspartyl aminopeptidase